MTRTTASGQIAGTGIPSRASSERQRGPRRWVAVVVVVVLVAARRRGGGRGRRVRPQRRHRGEHGQQRLPDLDRGGHPAVADLADPGGCDAGRCRDLDGGGAVGLLQRVIIGGQSSSSSAGGSSSGTFTWLPTVGQTVRQGQVIYRVSGSPVVLLYGSVPAYRDLSEGLTGADVRELNAGLVKLGYATARGARPALGLGLLQRRDRLRAGAAAVAPGADRDRDAAAGPGGVPARPRP